MDRREYNTSGVNERIAVRKADKKGTRFVGVGVFLFVITVAISCIEPYTLEGVDSNPDFLVVDGFLNATSGVATVHLSRALPLAGEADSYPVIADATVSLESDAGEIYFLSPVEAGTYVAGGLTIDHDRRYRLRIALAGASSGQYESDLVTIQKAAPIESIEYRPLEEDLKIYVNTTEVPGTTKYYRWRYQEAFEYNSPWHSSWYMGTEGEAVQRRPDEQVYICYREYPSFEILISSSQNLNSNVIRNHPVKSIPRNSIRISRMYSINVQQTGLTEEAYTYWLNLYKTTESTGGLFDPMPGQIFGNIRSVSDPDELVIGYFSGSTVEEKRIFISRADLPSRYVGYRAPFCDFDTVDIADLQFVSPGTLFGDALYSEMGGIVGFTMSSPACLDCRATQGGTTTKPEYWP